jgi:hypothetical protein
MKKNRAVLGAAAGLAMLAGASGAWGASYIQAVDGSGRFINLTDGNGDGGAKLTISDSYSASGYNLYYRIGGAAWQALDDTSLNVTQTGAAGAVYAFDFALDLWSADGESGDGEYDLFAHDAADATITYLSPKATGFGKVKVEWLGLTASPLELTDAETSGTAGKNDYLSVGAAAPVPLPPSVLLLGAGLAGLGIFGRRKHT